MKHLTALLFLSFVSSATAQGTVWVVDDGGGPGVDFTEIQPAVDAAADGDLVLVLEGFDYAGVVIDGKSLKLVGDAPATVAIDGHVIVRNLGPEQQVTLRSMVLDTSGLELESSAGPIWVDGVDLVSAISVAGISVTDCDAVSFHGVTAQPGALAAFVSGNGVDMLRIANSDVFLFDSTVQGNVGFAEGEGAYGIELASGSLFLYGCDVTGGTGGPGSGGFGWCTQGGSGGIGIHVAPGATLAHVDTEFAAGLGGAGGWGDIGPCPGGPAGSPTQFDAGSVLDGMPGDAQRYSLGSPVREGTSAMLEFDGAAGMTAVVLASTEQSHLLLPMLSGALVFGFEDFSVLPAGHTNAAGSLQVAMTVPNLPPGTVFAQLFTQALYFEPPGEYSLGSGHSLEILATGY